MSALKSASCLVTSCGSDPMGGHFWGPPTESRRVGLDALAAKYSHEPPPALTDVASKAQGEIIQQLVM